MPLTACLPSCLPAVGQTREESHGLYTHVDEAAERVVYVPITRGDITVHNESVVHGSGPNGG